MVVVSRGLEIIGCELVVIGGTVVVVGRLSVVGELSAVGLKVSSVVVGRVLAVILGVTFVAGVGERVVTSDGGCAVVCCAVAAVMVSEEVVPENGGEVVVCSVIKN